MVNMLSKHLKNQKSRQMKREIKLKFIGNMLLHQMRHKTFGETLIDTDREVCLPTKSKDGCKMLFNLLSHNTEFTSLKTHSIQSKKDGRISENEFMSVLAGPGEEMAAGETEGNEDDQGDEPEQA